MTSFEKILPILGLLLTLPACATSTVLSREPIEGVVLEEGTNKPIANALVVGLWHGTVSHGFVDARTVCYHVETATADESGRFTLPPTEKEYKYRDGDHYTSTIAYKPGYQSARVQRTKGVTYLQPFIGGREERLKYLLHLSSLVGCYGAGDEKPLVPVYKALYGEARGIATSDKDKDALQTVRRRALYAWSRPSRELTAREIEQAIQNDPYLREQFR